MKLRWSEANQRLTKLARELRGPDGILDDGWWNHQQLRSRGNTIEAGTSEVLRNIIAERVLGLPKVALMDFALTDDQLELKQAARAWLADRFPLDRDWEARRTTAGRARGARLARRRGGGPRLRRGGAAARGDGLRSLPRASTSRTSRRLPARRRRRDRRSRPARSQPSPDETPRFRAAAAAEALGVAQRALDLGVEHAKTREQFGKPIGTYQAVSHPLAQTYTDVELARSLVYWAAWCVAEEDERAPLAAAAAKAFATEAAVAACERSIQVHGGIGFTWEHPLHRFYKRAIWLEGFGARPPELRLEVANALLA